MKYMIVVLLFAILFYILSFSTYNWRKKNRMAAIGAAIIGFSAFALMFYAMFFGNYEL